MRLSLRVGTVLCVLGASLVVAPLPAHANPPCGAVVTAGLTLTGDLNCPGTALYVTGVNIVVNLNGYAVIGNDLTGTGIEVSGAGVQLVNGTVRRYATGVSVKPGRSEQQPAGNRLDRLRITGNKVGVELIWAKATTIVESQVYDNRSLGLRIAAASTDGQIVRNRFAKNGTGISLSQGSTQNRIAGNEISGNTTGVRFLNGGSGSVLEENTIAYNTDYGVDISGPGSSHNIVRRNQLTYNGVGAVLAFGGATQTGNQLLYNTASRNRGPGIAVFGDPFPDTILEGNLVEHNGAGPAPATIPPGLSSKGIAVNAVGGTTVTLRANQANSNTDLGIFAAGSVIDGGGNTATLNGNPVQCIGVVCP
jgi:parallel beta-helix repeat protein